MGQFCATMMIYLLKPFLRASRMKHAEKWNLGTVRNKTDYRLATFTATVRFTLVHSHHLKSRMLYLISLEEFIKTERS